MIYTSYYARFLSFPKNTFPIGISRIVPEGFEVTQLIGLAPSEDLLLWWRKSDKTKEDEEYFSKEYNKQLSRFHAQKLADSLYKTSNGQNVLLLSHGFPGAFDHRHLLRKWLNENGIECVEY